MTGVVGEAGLAAQRSVVVVEQLVVVREGEAWPVLIVGDRGVLREARKLNRLGVDQLGERRILQCRMEYHRKVVGGAAHSRAVQTGGCCGAGVECTEFQGQ